MWKYSTHLLAVSGRVEPPLARGVVLPVGRVATLDACGGIIASKTRSPRYRDSSSFAQNLNGGARGGGGTQPTLQIPRCAAYNFTVVIPPESVHCLELDVLLSHLWPTRFIKEKKARQNVGARAMDRD